jgi:hypothetical protein
MALNFVKDEAFTYPVYTAQVPHGCYQLTKPPFSKLWRANFFLNSSDAERTALSKLGKGSFETLEEGQQACNLHNDSQIKTPRQE